ncbi:hypothetical protein [Novacetimonas pomaceti]|uniref:Uncharacterized protein n=1 Tax=Novacetimonas pomaceti TaxID=2021998 RepID=A0A318QCT6_9PROT|nr:hypothetical protein [Novacetimonas pomaceti]MBV1832583.1 hypothetical protein [Novacetimonas pomaceti]PYD48359.1 hypothetical protein C3920_05365 [Novacetimonas pomaceti]PYD75228.1 hypothetical protein CFR71_10370 [Novacetimonas pomaceti]
MDLLPSFNRPGTRDARRSSQLKERVRVTYTDESDAGRSSARHPVKDATGRIAEFHKNMSSVGAVARSWHFIGTVPVSFSCPGL